MSNLEVRQFPKGIMNGWWFINSMRQYTKSGEYAYILDN